MSDQKRALYSAECCHKELTDMLREARESFEVWKSFSGVTIDDEWHKLSYYCPFVSSTVTAHYLTMIINLFIIGDEDRKVHGICYLRRKLIFSSVLTKAHDTEWGKQLNMTTPIQKKIKLVRNKYFAHRDKDYSWAKAMQKSGLCYTELDFLISLYYRFAEASAPVLNPMFINEKNGERSNFKEHRKYKKSATAVSTSSKSERR